MPEVKQLEKETHRLMVYKEWKRSHENRKVFAFQFNWTISG
jgi:hypothetical protein